MRKFIKLTIKNNLIYAFSFLEYDRRNKYVSIFEGNEIYNTGIKYAVIIKMTFKLKSIFIMSNLLIKKRLC